MNSRSVERFWAKVLKGPGCWEWTANRDRQGYGRLWIGGKQIFAHRMSWEISNGPIPLSEGAPNGTLCVCHRCDNPSCVRPAHLFLGTYQANMNDRGEKGRTAKGEGSGRSKLKACEVVEIRRLVSAGLSQKMVAKMFRITAPNVGFIVHRKTWAHI